MPALVMAAAWVLSLLCWCWIVLIFIQTAVGWFSTRAGAGPGFGFMIAAPVNWVRRLVPTVYRALDVAPWLTILLLFLLAAFVFRALQYWGLLHGSPGL